MLELDEHLFLIFGKTLIVIDSQNFNVVKKKNFEFELTKLIQYNDEYLLGVTSNGHLIILDRSKLD